DDDKGIPEMLVSGQRSLNADIPRSQDGVQPYVIFDEEQIERSMAANLGDFLIARLPMNTETTAASQKSGFGTEHFANSSSINLRGLGANQTLILVNGRRIPGLNSIFFGGSFKQSDINGIALSSVKRIEVLPST